MAVVVGVVVVIVVARFGCCCWFVAIKLHVQQKEERKKRELNRLLPILLVWMFSLVFFICGMHFTKVWVCVCALVFYDYFSRFACWNHLFHFERFHEGIFVQLPPQLFGISQILLRKTTTETATILWGFLRFYLSFFFFFLLRMFYLLFSCFHLHFFLFFFFFYKNL